MIASCVGSGSPTVWSQSRLIQPGTMGMFIALWLREKDSSRAGLPPIGGMSGHGAPRWGRRVTACIDRRPRPLYLGTRMSRVARGHLRREAALGFAHGSGSSVDPNAASTKKTRWRFTTGVAPVKGLFATAFEEGLIRTNPAAGVRLATGGQVEEDDGNDRVKALTEAELRQLLDKTAPEWQLFVTLVAHSGMRIGEAVAVRWGDIDFGTGRLNVRRRWYRGTFAPPKSRYGRRAIPLTEAMTRALWERRKVAADARNDALVWATAGGMPYNRSNLHARVIKPAAKAAGVPWAGWHSLRHTCATMLFRHGANAKQVQVWLGHHSPAFTLATYVHLMPGDAPEAAFLDAVLPVRATAVPASIQSRLPRVQGSRA
jgi:integrase